MRDSDTEAAAAWNALAADVQRGKVAPKLAEALRKVGTVVRNRNLGRVNTYAEFIDAVSGASDEATALLAEYEALTEATK
jgi:hypothetical protein